MQSTPHPDTIDSQPKGLRSLWRKYAREGRLESFHRTSDFNARVMSFSADALTHHVMMHSAKGRSWVACKCKSESLFQS